MPPNEDILLRVRIDLSAADKDLARFFEQVSEEDLELGGKIESPSGRRETSQLAKTNDRQLSELRKQSAILLKGFKGLGAAITGAVTGAAMGGQRGGVFGAATGAARGAAAGLAIAGGPVAKALAAAFAVTAQFAEVTKERAEDAMDQAAAFDPRAALAKARFNIARFQAARARAQLNAPFAVRAFEERRALALDPRHIGLGHVIDRSAMRVYAGALQKYRESDAPHAALDLALKGEKGLFGVARELEEFSNAVKEATRDLREMGAPEGVVTTAAGVGLAVGQRYGEPLAKGLEGVGVKLDKLAADVTPESPIFGEQGPIVGVAGTVAGAALHAGASAAKAPEESVQGLAEQHLEPGRRQWRSGRLHMAYEGAEMIGEAIYGGAGVATNFFKNLLGVGRGVDPETGETVRLPPALRGAISEAEAEAHGIRTEYGRGGGASWGNDPMPD